MSFCNWDKRVSDWPFKVRTITGRDCACSIYSFWKRVTKLAYCKKIVVFKLSYLPRAFIPLRLGYCLYVGLDQSSALQEVCWKRPNISLRAPIASHLCQDPEVWRLTSVLRPTLENRGDRAFSAAPQLFLLFDLLCLLMAVYGLCSSFVFKCATEINFNLKKKEQSECFNESESQKMSKNRCSWNKWKAER